MPARYSTAKAGAKAKALCSFSRSFGLERGLGGGARKADIVLVGEVRG